MAFRRYCLALIFIFKSSPRVHSYHEPADSRSLVITNGGIVKLIISLTMPVDLPIGLVWLQNIQFQYPMIESASQLTYLNLLRKSTSRAMTRNMVYGTLTETWNRFGENGTACVLRTICEVARFSFAHNGIIGELLHTVFRPHRTSFRIYHEAREFGEADGECKTRYSRCEDYFLDTFLV